MSKADDKRVAWLRSKVEISLGKKNDKKFEKAFLAEESVAKVRSCRLQMPQIKR